MRDHSKHIELSRQAAVQGMLDALPQSFGNDRTEQIALSDAFGRILAEDIRAKTDIPNCLTCAMDSVAVHWSDFENLAEGELPDTSHWTRGVEWDFANTGVAMPAGYDTAIVIEHVKVSDDENAIEILAAPSAQFAGTRAIASKNCKGDLMLAAGCIITPDKAAQIASAGYASVLVKPRPKVAFIPTGNELVPANLPYSSSDPAKYAGVGKVFESNSAVVQGKVEAWGGEYVPFDIVADERDAIRDAIERACKVADIVILNAGSSKGSDDWSVEVLDDMGHIVCHQTNHGPGHHSSYALVNETPIVGISGPSGGASFTLNFYLLPLMKRFFGFDPQPAYLPALLTEDFQQKRWPTANDKLPGEQRPSEASKPDDEFFGVKFLLLALSDTGELQATPVKGHPGSAETQHANAYCMIPAGPSGVPPKAGDIVMVELRNSTL